jgi:hypothetical protein
VLIQAWKPSLTASNEGTRIDRPSGDAPHPPTEAQFLRESAGDTADPPARIGRALQPT